MRMRTIGVILLAIWAALPVRADDPVPEWLPPPPVRPPVLDLLREEQPVRPGDEFSRILEIRPSNDTNNPWQPLAGRLKLTQETAFDSARWRSNLDLPDHRELRDTPALSRDWKSENSLNLPLPIQESMFMFGQFDTNGDADQTQRHVKGKTGVGMKWQPFSGTELQVRTGPTVKYEDVAQVRTTERSQLSVELQAKLALLGPLQLQYAGEALPAFAQADRHTLLQDLKLALPFGTNREVNVGAKYRWEDTLTQTPWMQRAELYMGFKFQR